MFFIILLSLITASIAGSAAFFSIYGLAQIFSGTFWAVVFMGSSLEAGKLIAASFLYRYWPKVSAVLKIYLIIAVVVLMFITSMGIFGFLSQSYMHDSLPLKEMQVKIDGLKQEQQQLTDRKQAIDNARQVAVTAAVNNQSTRTKVVSSKERLAKTYDLEVKEINKRLPGLTTELQMLNQQVLTTQLHTGPITYIAKALGREIDDATKWVIFMLIIAFDPLAVALTIGVNIVVNIRKAEKEQAKQLQFEKDRQDKLEQADREKQERVDARDGEKQRRVEELEDMRAKLQHEKEMESLKHNHMKIVASDENVIESFDDTPAPNTPIEYIIADGDAGPGPVDDPEPVGEEIQAIPTRDDSTIDELRRILAEMTTNKELSEEELHDKKQIELILSRKQILENMRSGSTS